MFSVLELGAFYNAARSQGVVAGMDNAGDSSIGRARTSTCNDTGSSPAHQHTLDDALAALRLAFYTAGLDRSPVGEAAKRGREAEEVVRELAALYQRRIDSLEDANKILHDTAKRRGAEVERLNAALSEATALHIAADEDIAECREIISRCATAVGALVTPQASLAFAKMLPDEISSVVGRLGLPAGLKYGSVEINTPATRAAWRLAVELEKLECSPEATNLSSAAWALLTMIGDFQRVPPAVVAIRSAASKLTPQQPKQEDV